MNLHLWLPRLLTGLISVFQASTLRDRYYTLEQRVTILEVAIEDIERINAAGSTPNRLITNICEHTRKQP
jgi:hypothetical protein